MHHVSHEFDFDTDNKITALNYFNRPDVEPLFTSIQKGVKGYGSGANKQVYMAIASGLTDTILIQSGYFADVNPQHDFWLHGAPAFCHFVKCVIKNDCKFPYHFAPGLLEVISKATMSTDDLQFYMEKIDPVVAKTITDWQPDTGYDSMLDALRSLCIGKSKDIYDLIGSHMKIGLARLRRSCRRTANRKSFIRKVDEMLSGPYVLTADMVCRTITCRNDTYTQALTDLIKTMTDAELRSMLLTFGNTINLNSRYDIFVGSINDIQICVCGSTVWLPEALFKSQDGLQILKAYLTVADTKISG